MRPILVLFAVILLASACAAVNCSAGQYLSGGSCYTCDACGYRNSCPASCFCTSDAGCGNKALFCSAASATRSNATTVDICRECDTFGCDYPSTVADPRRRPISGASLTQGADTYADCSASCGCTAHSQCPTGYFCGRSSPDSGANVCRRCSDFNNCYDQIAVDGSCPATSNCAASVQCTIQTQCSSPQYCAGNYKCKSCSTDCYAPPTIRARSSTFQANRLRGGWCPQACCGLVSTNFNRISSSDNTLSYDDDNDIVFLVCNAEQYSSSGFTVVVVENAAPESVTASQSSSVSCTLTVDISPNAATYPRYVPLVRCSVNVDSCEEKRFGLALFGTVAASGAQVRINNFTLHTDRRVDTCGLADALRTIGIIIGVLVALCVIGAIAGCVAFAMRKPAQSAQPAGVPVGQPVTSTGAEMQPVGYGQPVQGQPVYPPQQQQQQAV